MDVGKTARLCRWQGIGLLIAALFLGCSSGRLPNAPSYQPDPPVQETIAEGVSMRIALAPLGRTKPIGDLAASEILEKSIGARGGIMVLRHENSRAKFAVPPRALDERVAVSMRMFGSGAYSIIEFGPSGLQFNQPCTLSISFPSGDIDPTILGGYLLNDDGSTTGVPTRVVELGNLITVIVEIQHFSQYVWNDGEEAY